MPGYFRLPEIAPVLSQRGDAPAIGRQRRINAPGLRRQVRQPCFRQPGLFWQQPFALRSGPLPGRFRRCRVARLEVVAPQRQIAVDLFDAVPHGGECFLRLL